MKREPTSGVPNIYEALEEGLAELCLKDKEKRTEITEEKKRFGDSELDSLLDELDEKADWRKKKRRPEGTLTREEVHNYIGRYYAASQTEDGTIQLDIADDVFDVIGERAFSGLNVGRIRIPDGVTTIREEAFKECRQLKVVELPGSLRSIDASAFEGCAKLRYVGFRDGLYSIGVRAFADCFSLQKIILPASLTRIDDEAFVNCVSLETIEPLPLANALFHLGEMAFGNCKSLRNVKYSDVPQGAYHSEGWKAFKGSPCYRWSIHKKSKPYYYY